MVKVLIASPVRKEPAILRESFAGLAGLEVGNIKLSYLLIDDNTDPESSALLRAFADNMGAVVWPGEQGDEYCCDETTHHWTDATVQKVARFKDRIIAYATGFNFLFFWDSDLVLHPKTLTHLVSLGKDVVSEVFWTRWGLNQPPMPNVWQCGTYNMHKPRLWGGDHKTEIEQESVEFLKMLKTLGTYHVGGLGACTLLSRKALEAGVSFAPLANVDYTGEDRHFCVRAAVLGLELWADTFYPPYHIYRESELPGLAVWKDRQRERRNRITVGMLVRNEAGRYLERVLNQVCTFADKVVIVDDASTDDTASLCEEILDDHGLLGDVIVNTEHSFTNEVTLRQQLWELATKDNPDWVLILDADEILEDNIRAMVRISGMSADPEAEAYTFRLFDMWDQDHYRDDALWTAHKRPWTMMVRYIPGREYIWREQPLHCGRFPMNAADGLAVKDSGLRIKHMGYARQDDRDMKWMRYSHLDPEGEYGNLAQYHSILDTSPTLRPWVDEEKPPTISLCMIVGKDESDNLKRCLESVRAVVDDIIIVQTQGESLGNWLFDSGLPITECIGYWWEHDFSKARNKSLEYMRDSRNRGDWILFLDADEELPPDSRDGLRRLVQNAPPEVEGYFVKLVSEVGEGAETCPDLVFRLFRNRPEYRFEGAIHEQITESILRHQGRDCFGRCDDLIILHHGFTRAEIERKGKAGRNLAMIEATYPTDEETFRCYQYGIELMGACRWTDALHQFQRAAQGADPREIHLPKMIRGIVVCLMQTGRQERALAIARLGSKLFPIYADLYYYSGIIEQDRGNLQAAWKYFNRGEGCPEQPAQYSSMEGVRGWRTFYQKGRIEEQFGRLDLARGWYQSAIKDRPDFQDAAAALKRLEARKEANPAELSDWELFSLLLTVIHGDGDFDIVVENLGGRKSYRGSAEGLGKIVEGRGE